MKIYVGNVSCRAVIGGADNLIKLEPKLREYLRVRPNGYFFSKLYRLRGKDGERLWDGWRYFMTKRGEFATGFLELVVNYAEELGAKVTLIDERTNLPRLVKVREDVRHHKLMEHQSRTVGKLSKEFKGLPFPRGVFYCSTNSGKTTMAASVHFSMKLPDKKPLRSLFIVHKKEIYEQAVEFFQGAGINTGGIYAKDYDTGGEMTVGMILTLGNLLKKGDTTFLRDLKRFDVVFIDEGHHAGAAAYSSVMQACEAGVRIILSGTALENTDKVKNMVIVGLSGPVLARIKNTEMFAAGVSKKPIVTVIASPHRQGKVMTWAEEYRELIVKSKPRMDAIIEHLLKDLHKRTIVTFEEVEHGEFMFEELSAAFAWLNVEWTHGADKDRSHKLNRYKQGEIDILIVSMIVQEGLNLNKIQRMVFAHGGKSDIRNKQLAGRGMRNDGSGETTFELVEVWDRGLYTEKHSRARMKTYKDEGFDVIYQYDNRRGVPIK